MTSPRRVLMTVDAIGGVWQYALDLCQALAPLGVETVLACLGPAPDAARRRAAAAVPTMKLIDTGLDLDWLAADGATVDRSGAAVAALAEAQHVDLVHLNQPALAAAACFPVPVVAAVHSCVATWWDAVFGGKAPASFAWQTQRVAQGLRRVDAVVAPSRAFAATVRDTYALDVCPEVVSNGRAAFPDRDAPPKSFVFTAGRLWDRGKNVAALDRIAARLRWPFEAAGAVVGPNGDSIVLRHVRPLGALDDKALATRLASRPVFVSAARYEPFGLAVLEAALAGCPLVLADIPTLRETWDGAAWFVDPDDEDGFVDSIDALMTDSDARDAWGSAARRRGGNFTPARMAAGMVEIYSRVLASRPPDFGCAAA